MNPASTKLSVCVTDQTVFLRVEGPGNMHCSPDFKRVILELAQKGRTDFIIDLSRCPTTDSTFLGVLIGLVVKGPPPGWKGPWPQLRFYQPTERVRSQIENVGISGYLKLAEGVEPPTAPFTPVEGAAAGPSKLEKAKTSLEAHQTLMEANPANVPKFKDVVQFLAEDLKKVEGGK